MLKQSLPCVQEKTSFKKQAYVFSHKYLSTIASFRLSNGGLGNKFPLPGSLRSDICPLCSAPHKLSEQHLLFACSAVQKKRSEAGIDLYRTQSQLRGHSITVTHFLFVTGRYLAGNLLSIEDYLERGAAIHNMRSSWLDMHVSGFMVEPISLEI